MPLRTSSRAFGPPLRPRSWTGVRNPVIGRGIRGRASGRQPTIGRSGRSRVRWFSCSSESVDSPNSTDARDRLVGSGAARTAVAWNRARVNWDGGKVPGPAASSSPASPQTRRPIPRRDEVWAAAGPHPRLALDPAPNCESRIRRNRSRSLQRLLPWLPLPAFPPLPASALIQIGRAHV